MTTFDERTVRCFCCGTASSQQILASTNQMGWADLDQRPPEMMRSTMDAWLQECPSCGYVAKDLPKGDARERQFVDSDVYQALRTGPHASRLSCRFLLGAALARSRNDREQAFHHTLSAAWIADDFGMLELARGLRRQAARHLRSEPGSPDLRLRLLDVLRRSGAWEDAGLLAADMMVEPLADPLPTIVRFQLGRISVRDGNRYSVEDALAEPDTAAPNDRLTA